MGFEDAIGWVAAPEAGLPAHWHVTFSVADRDGPPRRRSGSAPRSCPTADSQWTRTALLRDPQGAVFTASQFTPPG